jgi:hypothetical protein
MNSSVEFNNLYNDCFQICERNNIYIPKNGVKRKRNENSSNNNTKETYIILMIKLLTYSLKKYRKDSNRLT